MKWNSRNGNVNNLWQDLSMLRRSVLFNGIPGSTYFSEYLGGSRNVKASFGWRTFRISSHFLIWDKA